MIQTKAFEIRDRATFIPAVATRLRAKPPFTSKEEMLSEAYLLGRAGFRNMAIVPVILTHLQSCESHVDMYDWKGDRTMKIAHSYIAAHWHELESGQVIDVEFILSESDAPKLSERVTI
jgi:hypothetical protein